MSAVQLLILVGVVVAVGQGLLSATRNATSEHDGHDVPARLPERIAGLALESWLSGPEAIQAVEQLHGTNVGIVDAYIGYYERQVTLWVGVTTDDTQAASLVDRMTSRIRGGNPVFAYLAQVRVDGLDVHQVQSGGQLHFYYQRGNEVIWVAAQPRAGGEFVGLAVKSIR